MIRLGCFGAGQPIHSQKAQKRSNTPKQTTTGQKIKSDSQNWIGVLGKKETRAGNTFTITTARESAAAAAPSLYRERVRNERRRRREKSRGTTNSTTTTTQSAAVHRGRLLFLLFHFLIRYARTKKKAAGFIQQRSIYQFAGHADAALPH